MTKTIQTGEGETDFLAEELAGEWAAADTTTPAGLAVNLTTAADLTSVVAAQAES
jgi:hypothetical protein